jgi:hypothetical protein
MMDYKVFWEKLKNNISVRYNDDDGVLWIIYEDEIGNEEWFYSIKECMEYIETRRIV